MYPQCTKIASWIPYLSVKKYKSKDAGIFVKKLIKKSPFIWSTSEKMSEPTMNVYFFSKHLISILKIIYLNKISSVVAIIKLCIKLYFSLLQKKIENKINPITTTRLLLTLHFGIFPLYNTLQTYKYGNTANPNTHAIRYKTKFISILFSNGAKMVIIFAMFIKSPANAIIDMEVIMLLMHVFLSIRFIILTSFLKTTGIASGFS